MPVSLTGNVGTQPYDAAMGTELDLLVRFINGVAYGQQTANGCLPWGGKPSVQGYGTIGHNDKLIPAHRASYMLFVGPVSPDLVIDHLCRNRLCVEPAHLEAVTQAENMRRGAANGMALFEYKCQDPSHHRVARPETKNPGRTRCYECTLKQQREHQRRYMAKKKAGG